MAMKRVGRTTYPQLPPAPDDYPTFPDTSTWPVVFPELPPAPEAGRAGRRSTPRRPARRRIPADQVPNHVAIVMDGNGRWAIQRGLNRTEGHKMGEAVLIDVTCGAIEIGIKHLTVYAFSTENWKRSTEEVRFLMGFNREVVRRRRENLDAIGVRMRWVGSRPRMWRSVIKEFEIAENMTLDNTLSPSTTASTTVVAPKSSRPQRKLRVRRPTGGSTRTKSPNRVSPATFTVPTFRTSTSSFGPRGSSGPATSCCGRRRMPNTSSRTSCGPISTVATCGTRVRSTSTATGVSGGPRWSCNGGS